MPAQPDITTERKTQIIQAALTIFGQQGLNARMADIADEAGVSKGTLYLYFDSKDDLIEAILLTLFDEDLQALESLVAEDSPAIDRLHRYVQQAAESFGIMKDQIAIALEILASAARDESFRSLLDGYYRRYWLLLGDLLQQGVDRGELRADLDTYQTARHLVSLLDGEMLVVLLRPDMVDMKMSFDYGLQIILDGIRNKDTP